MGESVKIKVFSWVLSVDLSRFCRQICAGMYRGLKGVSGWASGKGCGDVEDPKRERRTGAPRSPNPDAGERICGSSTGATRRAERQGAEPNSTPGFRCSQRSRRSPRGIHNTPRRRQPGTTNTKTRVPNKQNSPMGSRAIFRPLSFLKKKKQKNVSLGTVYFHETEAPNWAHGNTFHSIGISILTCYEYD
jgi:hypothetical protein